jgi:DNA-binding NarL/FixJ family response regulator
MNMSKERRVLVMSGSSEVPFESAAPARPAETSVTIGSRSELKLKGAAAKIGGNVEKAVLGTRDGAAGNAKKWGAFNAPSCLSTINWRAGAIGGQDQSLAHARFLAGSDSEQERHMTAPAHIRILSVDCHPLVQEGIATTVNAQSDMLVVSTALRGTEGIRNHRDHRPDVTLMDLVLPDMSGIDAMIAIRADSPEARIIILTTCEGDVQVRRALAAGARSYLLKSMALPDLVKVIRDVYAGHRRVSHDLVAHVVDHLGDEALTPREIEVLEQVAGGNRNRDIGERLFISEETVKVHVKHLMDKLGAKDRTQAFAIAVRRGIIQI